VSATFWGAAISRQDGSPGDGIHLLWTTPPGAPYSVKGYDIQRRLAKPARESTCLTLTADDLARLHRDLHLETRLGRIFVRRAPCPKAPAKLPDDPNRGGEPQPAVQCVDFRRSKPAQGANPLLDKAVRFELRVNGALAPVTRIILHDTARVGLERYLRQRLAYAPMEPHVFVSLRRKPLLVHDVVVAFRTAARAIGWPDRRTGAHPTPHSLRHTLAVRALQTCPDGPDAITQHMLARSELLGTSGLFDQLDTGRGHPRERIARAIVPSRGH
jgi:hypothetical protein